MMVKMNAKESLEIVEDVFVNIINEHGVMYLSWDELSEKQQGEFRQIKQDLQTIYDRFKGKKN